MAKNELTIFMGMTSEQKKSYMNGKDKEKAKLLAPKRAKVRNIGVGNAKQSSKFVVQKAPKTHIQYAKDLSYLDD